jgi:hypothetical protein
MLLILAEFRYKSTWYHDGIIADSKNKNTQKLAFGLIIYLYNKQP